MLTITGFDQHQDSSFEVAKNMAAILQFEKKVRPDMQDLPSGHTATILLYTGVRFERIDFAAIRESSLAELAHGTLGPARRAN
jgi:hypothetical protein